MQSYFILGNLLQNLTIRVARILSRVALSDPVGEHCSTARTIALASTHLVMSATELVQTDWTDGMRSSIYVKSQLVRMTGFEARSPSLYAYSAWKGLREHYNFVKSLLFLLIHIRSIESFSWSSDLDAWKSALIVQHQSIHALLCSCSDHFDT